MQKFPQNRAAVRSAEPSTEPLKIAASQSVDGDHFPELLYGTDYASFMTPNGSANYVYYQGVDGSINETSYPRGSGWGSFNLMPPGKAMLHTPLAAVRWGPGNHFRLYYLSPTFQLCELVCENNAWSDGALNAQKFQAAPFSSLSAITFANGGELRIYFQDKNYKIIEVGYGNGKWNPSPRTLLGNPLPGTSLAFCNRNPVDQGTPSIRGYYQEMDGRIRELVWGNDWAMGEWAIAPTDTIFRTPLAVTASQFKDGSKVFVYFITHGNSVVEITNHHSWSEAQPILDVSVAPNTKLSVCSFQRNTDHVDVRLYTTGVLNALHEKIYRNDVWEPWVAGNAIAIGTKLTTPMLVYEAPPIMPASKGVAVLHNDDVRVRSGLYTKSYYDDYSDY